MRPEAEQRMRAGFQRRVDQQAARHAVPLAHAEQLALQLEGGEVVGVFCAETTGVRMKAYVIGLLPFIAFLLLLIGAAVGLPVSLPLVAALPIVGSVWFGYWIWRARFPQYTWLHAFTRGLVLLDSPDSSGTDPVLLRWDQVTGISEVWTDVYDMVSEETKPKLTGYRLGWADGQVRDIPLTFMNVRDPYRQMGQLFRGLAPNTVGRAMPVFPRIDEVLARYAGRPGS